MGLIFLGLSIFRVGKSIFSRYGGYNTKKVPKKCLHVPLRGTLMRARRVTHTPTRHQTLPWGPLAWYLRVFEPMGPIWCPLARFRRTDPHPTARYRTISHDIGPWTNNKLVSWGQILSVVGQTRQVGAVWIGEKYFANYPIGYLILRCTSADSRQKKFFFQKCVRAF